MRTAALVAATVAGAAWGVVAGWWTPRGPLTTTEALVSLGVSLAVGFAAGALARSRSAVLVAPLAFALAVELVRLPTDGASVDGIHLTTYGLLAFATGRVFHALLSLLPLALGAALGAGWARRRAGVSAGPPVAVGVRRGVAALTAAGLVALAVGLAIPARTDPIAGGIAALTTVEADGHDLGLMLRGQDPDAPVLLFLAGGPGGSELGAMRRHLPELEEHFVVATLDQRGTGRSYDELDPADTYTLDSAVADVLTVTDYLRERFEADRVLLVGQSWGSTLGVLAVQARPDAFSGLVGVGQMVSQRATDTLFYRATLEWARERGDDGLVGQLEEIGPPPYDSMLDYETALSYEHEVWPYDHTANSEGEGGFSENFLVEEYALIDQVHLLPAFMDTFGALYPQLQEIDFRETATSLEVPVFFVQGAHEAPGRAEPFEEWYPMLEAPVKDRITLDTSGHRPLFEQPDEFVDYLTTTVLRRIA